jgi:endonuclease/exonuclease/phosphatase family metal-dependent hydrolase
MNTRLRILMLAGLISAAAACNDGPTSAAPLARAAARDAASAIGAAAVSVMTQNMYVGADLDVVIAALASSDPSDDVPALLGAIQTIGRTDFPARANAMADAIARTRPHVVGLQEVSVIHVDLRAFGLPDVIDQDFLATLQDDLAARGLHYVVAGRVHNLTAAPLPGISLDDYDAMLVDADRVAIVSASGQTYAANVGVVAPGIDLKSGWVTTRVTIAGVPYAFASTHLASGNVPGFAELRALQAGELAASLPDGVPAIVMGDLNDHAGSPMYEVLTGAGFTDTWSALRPGTTGYTCCEAADLSNHLPTLVERIDFVLARGIGVGGQVNRVGEVPADRVAGAQGPVWPSDHAGLVVNLLAPPGRSVID